MCGEKVCRCRFIATSSMRPFNVLALSNVFTFFGSFRMWHCQHRISMRWVYYMSSAFFFILLLSSFFFSFSLLFAPLLNETKVVLLMKLSGVCVRVCSGAWVCVCLQIGWHTFLFGFPHSIIIIRDFFYVVVALLSSVVVGVAITNATISNEE